MPMSRKDYVLLAEFMRQTRVREPEPDDPWTSGERLIIQGRKLQWEEMNRMLQTMLHFENDRFDFDKFQKAVMK